MGKRARATKNSDAARDDRSLRGGTGPERKTSDLHSIVALDNERTHLGRLLCRGVDPGKRLASLATLRERGVSVDAFFLPAHKLIFREIIDCADSGVAPDYLLIDQRLRDRGPAYYAEIGQDYLFDLSEEEPHSFISPGLTERLIELGHRRKVYFRTVDLTNLILEPSSPFSDVVDSADGLTAHLDADGSDDAVFGRIRTTRELFDAAKPPKYLIRNFLTAGSLVTWAAPEKAWKTTLGVMLALVVAGFGKFLGYFEGVEKGPVLFFSGESGDWPLSSMMSRILEWLYREPFTDPNGNLVSLKPPDPDDIPIMWGGDPPDLGMPGTIPFLRRSIRKHNAKLLILDPSQALFASLGDNVKNDFAMRQYMKKLQGLARETGCCVLLLHHFRQNVAPGIPKRSDSSFGGFMKFSDTWILANNREFPSRDDEPGSGKLWLTWGSRDGFAGTVALDINEGTEETGRHFECTIADPTVTMDSQAAAKAERRNKTTSAARESRELKRKEQIRAAMSEGEFAFERETVAKLCGLSLSTIKPVFRRMFESGEIVQGPRQYRNNGAMAWTKGYCLPERLPAVVAAATANGWIDPESNGGVEKTTGG